MTSAAILRHVFGLGLRYRVASGSPASDGHAEGAKAHDVDTTGTRPSDCRGVSGGLVCCIGFAAFARLANEYFLGVIAGPPPSRSLRFWTIFTIGRSRLSWVFNGRRADRGEHRDLRARTTLFPILVRCMLAGLVCRDFGVAVVRDQRGNFIDGLNGLAVA